MATRVMFQELHHCNTCCNRFYHHALRTFKCACSGAVVPPERQFVDGFPGDCPLPRVASDDAKRLLV